MSPAITIDDFRPHVGETCELKLQEAGLSLDLVEVTPKGQSLREGGAFALLWEAPSDPMLAQGIYSIRVPDLGAIEVFIVPVAQFDDVIQYEAVFT